MTQVRRIDRSPVTWCCLHCSFEAELAEDPRPIFAHLIECSSLPEDERAGAVEAHQYVSEIDPLERVLAAHLIKHPEDVGCQFALDC